MKHKLLLVDDDALVLKSYRMLLEGTGFEVVSANFGSEAVALLRENPHAFSLVLVDYRLKDEDGAAVIAQLRAINPQLYVLVLSGDSSRSALKATWRAGAMEFLDKSLAPELVLESIRAWCAKFEHTYMPAGVKTPKVVQLASNNHGMIGRSNTLSEISKKIGIYQQTQRHVLILGESGVGKELVARALHSGANSKFRAINCASFRSQPTLLESSLFGHVRGAFTGADKDKKGIFEEADGGTVFLDEVHHLSPDVQVSLLRMIQEKKVVRIGSNQEVPVSFRIVAAAKPDLIDQISKGKFQLDLYYRLRGACIEVPALRDRPEDIEPLVTYFTEKWNQEFGANKAILQSTLRYLEAYSWPGNIRELENTIYELLDLSPGLKITPSELDPRFFSSVTQDNCLSLSLKDQIHAVEKKHIEKVVSHSKSLREAAKKMSISPPSLLRLMKKHQLSVRKFTQTTSEPPSEHLLY